MGWVTLTLRKTELKQSHTDYQNRLLQISREKRKMARENAYQQLLFNNQFKEKRDELYANYLNAISPLKEKISNEMANPSTDPNGNKVVNQDQINQWNNEIRDEKEKYERELNLAEEGRDEELQMLEDIANDQETMLDQEQVKIEAQLEAIKAEMDAVGEAISSQIQDSTIKLS